MNDAMATLRELMAENRRLRAALAEYQELRAAPIEGMTLPELLAHQERLAAFQLEAFDLLAGDLTRH